MDYLRYRLKEAEQAEFDSKCPISLPPALTQLYARLLPAPWEEPTRDPRLLTPPANTEAGLADYRVKVARFTT